MLKKRAVTPNFQTYTYLPMKRAFLQYRTITQIRHQMTYLRNIIFPYSRIRVTH